MGDCKNCANCGCDGKIEVTWTTDEETMDALDEIAEQLEVDVDDVIAEAVELYIALKEDENQ